MYIYLLPLGSIWENAFEKMGIMIDACRKSNGAELSTLFLYHKETNELYSRIAKPEPIEIAIPAGCGIAGSCFTSKQTINVDKPYEDTRFFGGIDRRTGIEDIRYQYKYQWRSDFVHTICLS